MNLFNMSNVAVETHTVFKYSTDVGTAKKSFNLHLSTQQARYHKTK